MKIECSIEKIKNAIIQASHITGKNATLPVLNSILFIATDKQFRIRATNLNIGIEIPIPAKIEQEGVLAIKSDFLTGFFAHIPTQGTVCFELVNDVVLVTTKQVSASFKTVPVDDFPTIPVVETDPVSINTKQFIEGLKSVYYATALSDIKPEIASVYIYKEDDYLVFVATDSFRLAEKKIKTTINEFTSVLIPYKNVIEIIRLVGEFEDIIECRTTKTQISLTDPKNGLYVTSRVIDGVFPDYRVILPKETIVEVLVLKQDFIQALKVSNVFSDKFNQVTFTITENTKSFSLSTKNNDIGEQTMFVDAKIKGGDITASYNHKYFIDAFQSIQTETISLSFTVPNRPIVMRGIGDTQFLYLIMPLNR